MLEQVSQASKAKKGGGADKSRRRQVPTSLTSGDLQKEMADKAPATPAKAQLGATPSEGAGAGAQRPACQ